MTQARPCALMAAGGLAVLIELMFLNGREKLADYPLHSILTFDGE